MCKPVTLQDISKLLQALDATFGMGREWPRTEEQDDFLKSQLPDYVKASLNGRVDRFTNNTHELWFERWPEREALFGPQEADGPALTPDQKKQLALAVKRRKKVSKC